MKPDWSDLVILAGGALMSYGAWLAYQPAGYIVAGACVTAVGLLAARREPPRSG